MQFEGALVREQGVTFAIVIVKPHVLNSGHQAMRLRIASSRHSGRADCSHGAKQPGSTDISWPT